MDAESSRGASQSAALPSASERKLVHWINSLPFVSCLLIDELDELRFGDVLQAIVAWIQRGLLESTEKETALDPRDSVMRVVQFAAQQCRAEDADVMYIVHGVQCAADVLEGDVSAIAAVVTVLRRLVGELEHAKRAQLKQQALVDRRSIELAIDQRRNQTKAKVVGDPTGLEVDPASRKGPSTARPTPCQSSIQGTKSKPFTPRATVPTTPSGLSLARGVVKEKTRTRRGPTVPDENTDRANNITNAETKNVPTAQSFETIIKWIQSMGVAIDRLPLESRPLDEQKARSLFADGVVLCALAAVIAKRRGGIAIRHKFHIFRHPQNGQGILFPRSAAMQPRTNAEKRHNVAIAWNILNDCGVLPAAALPSDSDQIVQSMINGGGEGPESIWSILTHVKTRCYPREPSKGQVAPPSAKSRVSLRAEEGKRRPYITSAQMDTSKKWMKSVGVDPFEVSSGILEDPLRNGVALCQLLCRIKLMNLPKHLIRNPPKTLIEVRANIHEAIGALIHFGESKMPSCYLTKQAVEGVILGDKQFIYGIVWHLMQFCKDQDAKEKQLGMVSVKEATVSTAPQEETVIVPLPVASSHRTGRRLISPLELDVPAGELVDEESRSCELTCSVGIGSVPWESTEMSDDIMPRPNRPRPRRLESEDFDHDIVPQVRPSGNNSALSKPNSTSQSSSPNMKPRTDERKLIHETVTTEQSQQDTALRVERDGTLADSQPPAEAVAPSAQPKQKSGKNDRLSACMSVSASEVDQVLSWIKSLRINLEDTAAFHDPESALVEFKSGVLLCSIVERLEHMRSMEGVCRQENIAKANALHNIDKAFEILQRKKNLPTRLFRRRIKIYEGDRATIVNLLLQMRKVECNSNS